MRRLAHVTHFNFTNVTVLETAGNTVVSRFDLGAHSGGFLDVTPSGRFAYIASQETDAVLVVETATNTTAATIETAPAPLCS